MTLDTDVPSSEPVHPDQPGRCNEHPELELTTAKLAGIRWYGWRERRVYCSSPDHNPYEAARCRFCGGPLFPKGRQNGTERREFCSALHRNYGWRVERRRERARARAMA